MFVALSTAELKAEISTTGAELVTLRDEAGCDLLWNGDPAVWAGRSPILFPTVGSGASYPVTVNGTASPLRRCCFAQTLEFEVVDATPASCELRLLSSAATRPYYPFEFELTVIYQIRGRRILILATVTNSGPNALPASFGFQPVFRWPLPYGGNRESYKIHFERVESAPIRRLDCGLVSYEPLPNPVVGRSFNLRDNLFDTETLIFGRLASHSLTYGTLGRTNIELRFHNLPHLGIWTKPGADFVCVQPWHGYPSLEDFTGDLTGKPSTVAIPSEGSITFALAISLVPSALGTGTRKTSTEQE
jgi:galactose mutarotase-like enzyme